MPENTNSFNTIFFDIGATLGIVSTTGQVLTLEVFPGVTAIISELKKRPVRLGIVFKIGDFAPAAVNQMLQACGLFNFFDVDLLHYISGDKPKDKAAFEKALAKTGDTNATSVIFIGEDPQERSQAASAGMRVGARPADALAMLDHDHL